MKTVILPWEIFDYILAFVSDDKPTLGACGLVCKATLSLSRKHLFRVVKLLLDRNDATFYKLITSPWSSIPQYIYQLELSVCDVWIARYSAGDRVIGILSAKTHITSLV